MIVFDLEINKTNKRIADIGAIYKDKKFRSSNINYFIEFINKTKPSFYAGHNIVKFDLKYLNNSIMKYINADKNSVSTLNTI